MLSETNPVTIFFRVSFIFSFVALEKSYRMTYVKNLVIFSFEIKDSMKINIDEKYGHFPYSAHQYISLIPCVIK